MTGNLVVTICDNARETCPVFGEEHLSALPRPARRAARILSACAGYHPRPANSRGAGGLVALTERSMSVQCQVTAQRRPGRRWAFSNANCRSGWPCDPRWRRAGIAFSSPVPGPRSHGDRPGQPAGRPTRSIREGERRLQAFNVAGVTPKGGHSIPSLEPGAPPRCAPADFTMTSVD